MKRSKVYIVIKHWTIKKGDFLNLIIMKLIYYS